MRKIFLITFSILLLTQGCKESVKKPKTKTIDVPTISKSENIKTGKTDLGGERTVKTYLALLEENDLKNANGYVLPTAMKIRLKKGGTIDLLPVKTKVFDYLKVRKMEPQKYETRKYGILFSYTVMADVKWPNDEKLDKNYVFFLNTLKSGDKWLVDGPTNGP